MRGVHRISRSYKDAQDRLFWKLAVHAPKLIMSWHAYKHHCNELVRVSQYQSFNPQKVGSSISPEDSRGIFGGRCG